MEPRPIAPARLLSRTDRVIEAMTREVEARRSLIDGTPGLVSVSATVSLDSRDRVRRTHIRAEAASDIPSERREE